MRLSHILESKVFAVGYITTKYQICKQRNKVMGDVNNFKKNSRKAYKQVNKFIQKNRKKRM